MPAVDYERLRYIQLKGDGSKLPQYEWGGYSQDFDEAEHVREHNDGLPGSVRPLITDGRG